MNGPKINAGPVETTMSSVSVSVPAEGRANFVSGIDVAVGAESNRVPLQPFVSSGRSGAIAPRQPSAAFTVWQQSSPNAPSQQRLPPEKQYVNGIADAAPETSVIKSTRTVSARGKVFI